ncbi:MAG TPA: GDSL-type esterase/lipase family protein [Ferruginibacter sp.]|nr:GDSL-type esterase/lipase family protein [Ferruginibacter sp.]
MFLLSPVIKQSIIASKTAINSSIETPTQNFDDQIHNANGLDLVKQRIRMANSSLTMIRVLHIGDSHVKSGFFSEPFMQKLNNYYGQKYNGRLFFNFQVVCKIGTKYTDYDQLPELNAQLKNELPDLVIISLGTNDAFSESSETDFYQKVDRLISKIKALSPNSAILITTPPDGLKFDKHRGTYADLPEVAHVTNVLIKYADDHAIAYWDLYHVMGGANSMNSWYQKRLAMPDHVHFNAEGYGILAQSFFEAFITCMDKPN